MRSPSAQAFSTVSELYRGGTWALVDFQPNRGSLSASGQIRESHVRLSCDPVQNQTRLRERSHHMQTQIAKDLREFIVSSFLFGDTTRLPDDEASLIDEGIVDSTGI